MFTGIIQDIGEVTAIDKSGDWTVAIAVNRLPLEHMAIGASICCDGVCLTVIAKDSGPHSHIGNRDEFKVHVSPETLKRTTVRFWSKGTRLNLEAALRMGDELGGHLVSGHVDGTARIREKHKDSGSLRLVFEVSHEFAHFIAPKGSIALNGVSLTVNEVENATFGVTLIPHTQSVTTFSALEAGDEVNFEVDLMARYADRLLRKRA